MAERGGHELAVRADGGAGGFVGPLVISHGGVEVVAAETVIHSRVGAGSAASRTGLAGGVVEAAVLRGCP